MAEPVIVLHCGSDTVIRCGGHDWACPQAKAKVIVVPKVEVVPKVITRTEVVKSKPRQRKQPGLLEKLLGGH